MSFQYSRRRAFGFSGVVCLLAGIVPGAFGAGCAPTGGETSGASAQAASSDNRGRGNNNNQVLVSTSESDCAEVAFPRALSEAAVRQYVPARYGLVPVVPGAVLGLFTEYHCASVTVDGHQARDTNVSIGSAQLSSRDGVEDGNYYIIWIATDNSQLYAKYRSAGLPVEFVQHSTYSATVDPSGGPTSIAQNFVGRGLDHTINLTANEPDAGPISVEEGADFYYDSKHGDLQLSFQNAIRPPSTAFLSGDYTPSSVILPLFYLPRLAKPNFNVTFVRGNWTAELLRL